MLNLAQVYNHFYRTEEARELYQKYLTMFKVQSSDMQVAIVTGSQSNWAEDPKHCKLRDVAQAAIDEMDAAGGDGEEE